MSSSTPVRRSSPRLAIPADGNSETGHCLSPAKSRGTRNNFKHTALDNGIVPTGSNRNLLSTNRSKIDQTEHQHHLRNSAIKSSQISCSMHDMTDATNSFSSRRSSLNDKRDDFTPDVNGPTEDGALPIRRKRGWPKGVPRKKQVIQFLRLCSVILIIAFR